MIKGEKTGLREVRRADLGNFLKGFNDPEVTQYLSHYLPMTEMGEEKWIEGLADRAATEIHFTIEALDGDAAVAIGSVGLSHINGKDSHATFGIAIGEKDYWSRGYGTEAAALTIRYGFEQLNLHRISSSAFAFNERSCRMHRSIGFADEGSMRSMIYKNGSYSDLVMFGMLRDEWLKNKKE